MNVKIAELSYLYCNGPFAAEQSRGTKSPYWRANDTLGHVKESHQTSRDCSAAKGPLARLLPEGCAVKHVTRAIFSVVKGLVSNARVT